MKKTILYLSIALFILTVAFSTSTVNVSAASNKTLMTKYLKAFKNADYQKANSYIKKMKKTDKDTSLNKMSKKQKKAYLKVVKKYAKNLDIMYGDFLWGYYLADLNKDKKPELLVQYGSCEADVRTYVYTYKKGKAKKQYKQRHTDADVCDRIKIPCKAEHGPKRLDMITDKCPRFRISKRVGFHLLQHGKQIISR